MRTTVTAILLSFLILALPRALTARAASENDDFLSVGAVQFAVSREVYSSAEAFRGAIEDVLDKVENEAAAEGIFPDLVVFPENTSAFLGISVLTGDEVEAVREDPAGNLDLIKEAIESTQEDVVDIWKDISSDRDYAILAGSALVIDSTGDIRNRAYLYSPDGEIVWTQDKVFPGAPEESILSLSTGKVSDAESFEIDGFDIVTTICRDTYYDVWETSLPDADLWIDIKANELNYSQEYYDGALTSRLPDSPIDRGLTVSLAGTILGFRFTGPTEYLYDMGPIAGTDPYEKNAILLVQLPREKANPLRYGK